EKLSPEARNLRAYRSRGVDVSADFGVSLAIGTVSSRLMATHTLEQLVQPSLRAPLLIDISGVTGSPGAGSDWEPAPDWAAQWITTSRRGAFAVTAHARYVSAGKKHATRLGPQDAGYDPDAEDSIDDNRVPSYMVWALGGSYDFELGDARVQL